MSNTRELRHRLQRIDGAGYKAYQDLRGEYRCERFMLFIDHVQGDPFASPSRIRVRVLQPEAGFPEYLYNNPERCIALGDIIARKIAQDIKRWVKGRRGTGKSGQIYIDSGGQEVLARTAVKVGTNYLEARLSIGLPAAGRRVLAREAEAMLLEEIPRLVEESMYFASLEEKELRDHILLYEDQNHIRRQLKNMGLVAFVGNGSILPRRSGVSNLPLTRDQAVPFLSPRELEVELKTLHHGNITGMGIPAGVTLIVGGGYHGKTTLLKAMERGVYNHIIGDGREWVITVPQAVKIRAEDGRFVQQVNIRPFIDNLPLGQDTIAFSSDNASGSTSQAANIVEALEAGAEVLLLDEDTSATNFMIRDARMQQLVHSDKEPITPFIDRVGELYREQAVSTIIVMGGAGDYFDVCDRVIMMDNYRPQDVTEEARRIAREFPNHRQVEAEPVVLSTVRPRVPLKESFDPHRGRKVKVDARGLENIVFGNTSIDIRLLEQLVDASQTRAMAEIIFYAARYVDGRRSLTEILKMVYRDVEEKGLDVISRFKGQHPGDLAYPRILEAAAAINRMRTLRLRQN